MEFGLTGRVGPIEHLQLNGFRRSNAGHRRDVADDMGVLLRWQTAF
jgi:hypothetical protein